LIIDDYAAFSDAFSEKQESIRRKVTGIVMRPEDRKPRM
jgi:hypothetical protein